MNKKGDRQQMNKKEVEKFIKHIEEKGYARYPSDIGWLKWTLRTM